MARARRRCPSGADKYEHTYEMSSERVKCQSSESPFRHDLPSGAPQPASDRSRALRRPEKETLADSQAAMA